MKNIKFLQIKWDDTATTTSFLSEFTQKSLVSLEADNILFDENS